MRRLVVGSAILALTAATFSWTWADDQEIARKVAERLKQEQKEGNLRGFDINLKVAEGRVTLKGDVSSAQQEELAVEAARQVDGVEDVVNDLQVKAPATSSDAGSSESTASSTTARKSLLGGLLNRPTKKQSIGDGTETVEAAPSPSKRSDAELAQDVAKALEEEKKAGNLKDFNIDLSVKRGVVILDGNVSTAEQVQLALQRSRDIEGVHDVISHLVVTEKSSDEAAKSKAPLLTASRLDQADSSGTPDPKQAGEDRRIGAAITQGLKEAKQSGQLHGFGISVNVENGCVWLKGRVGSAAQQKMALDLARHTSGVRQVINELTVGEPPANIAQNLSQRLRAAEADGALRGTSLNVKVDGPDVWLTGLVSTPEQEKLAVDLARQVSGVRRVISGVNIADVTPTSLPVLAAPQTPAAIQFTRTSAPQSQLVAASRSAGPTLTQTAAQLPEATSMPGLPLPAEGNAGNSLAPSTYAATGPAVGLDQTPRPLGMHQLASYAGAMAAAPLVAVSGAAGVAPAQLPGPGYAVVPARYDHPSLPGYAWPTYAAHPNYAAVTYPKQYSPSAWPYIGPFYPYPQVPLGWRKVTLKWDDGWWNLDFKAK